MAPILAVASLTVRESIRRRAFLVMAFFAVFLLASSAFFPHLTASGQVRLVETWGLRATLLFGILLVVFLASLSLPQDIEEKKVFMLITKPLSRPGLYLGKWLGFAALLAMFLATMGALTLGYVRFVAWQGGAEAAAALDVRDRILAPKLEIVRTGGSRAEAEFSTEAPPRLNVVGPDQDFIAWHFRGLTFSAWPEGCVERLLRVKIRVHLTPGSGPIEVRTLAFTRLEQPLALRAPQTDHVEDGDWITYDIPVPGNFQKDDGDMRLAVFQPPGQARAIGGGPLDAQAILINRYELGDVIEYTYTSYSTVVGSGYAQLQAVSDLETLYNPKTGKHTIQIHRSPPLLARWVFDDLDADRFDRNATIEVRLPVRGPMFRKYGYVFVTVRSEGGKELDRRKLRVATNRPTDFPIDPAWVRDGQSLIVEVERGEPDTILALVPGGVALRSRAVAFESGFLRALVLIYLELLLLLAIVLPCSTWLSGPVSLFVGIALFICGMALEEMQETMVHLESAIRAAELFESDAEHGHRHHGLEFPLWALKGSRFVSKGVLAVFPRLERFEGAPLLIAGVQIPLGQVAGTAAYVGLYTLAASIVAMLIMRFREFR